MMDSYVLLQQLVSDRAGARDLEAQNEGMSISH